MEAELKEISMPPGLDSEGWSSRMKAFLDWRKWRKSTGRSEPYFTDDFYVWWFRTRSWAGRILDVGGGDGGKIRRLAQMTKIQEHIVVDPICEPGEISGTHIVEGIGESMPFIADGWANVAVALSVMQHCLDPKSFISEVHRCLAKDGIFTGTVCCGEANEMTLALSPKRVNEMLLSSAFEVTREDVFRNDLYCFEAVSRK